MIFEIGDKIRYVGPPQKRPPAVREIVKVMPSGQVGYAWRYPDMGPTCPSGDENLFFTQNTPDPLLRHWSKI